MANRNQNQDQNQGQQKGRRNPVTTPDDDEAQQGDQGQLAGQQSRRGGRQEPDEPLSEVQQEEDEAGTDEEGDEGMNRPS
jgi:hypothetical protein